MLLIYDFFLIFIFISIMVLLNYCINTAGEFNNNIQTIIINPFAPYCNTAENYLSNVFNTFFFGAVNGCGNILLLLFLLLLLSLFFYLLFFLISIIFLIKLLLLFYI